MSDRLDYLPDVLDEFEEEVLLDEPNPRCFTGIRNYAILKLFLNTGITSPELVKLTWDCVDMYEAMLYIEKEDSRNNRELMINFETNRVIKNWYHRQVNKLRECEYVFTTSKGTPVSMSYIRQMITRYADRAYISKNVSTYTLRHTFATKLYKSCKDLDEVQRALGLKTRRSVLRYRLLADENVNTMLY